MGLSGVGFAFCVGASSFGALRKREAGHRHKSLTEWAWQLLVLLW